MYYLLENFIFKYEWLHYHHNYCINIIFCTNLICDLIFQNNFYLISDLYLISLLLLPHPLLLLPLPLLHLHLHHLHLLYLISHHFSCFPHLPLDLHNKLHQRYLILLLHRFQKVPHLNQYHIVILLYQKTVIHLIYRFLFKECNF